VTGPPGPGRVTTGLGSLDMRQRNRDLARRGTGAFTSGSGQVTRPAGPVALARGGTVVLEAHLACRIGARAQAGRATPGPRWSHRAGGRSRWCSRR
jgi:hypothetical protein